MGGMQARATGEGAAGWTVRSRITAATLLMAVLGLAAAGGIAYLAQRDRLLSDVDARLHAIVEQVALVAEGPEEAAATPGAAATADDPAGADPATPGHESIVAPAGAYPDAAALLRALVSRLVLHQYESTTALLDGTVRYVPAVQTGVPLQENQGLLDRIVEEVARYDAAVLGTAAVPEGHLRYVGVPLRVEGDDSLGLYVSAILLEAELAPLEATFAGYALIAAIAAAVVGVAAWLLAGRLLRPLRTLGRTASRITLSDLSERIPVRGRDDVSELTETMNATFDRLEQAVTAQRHLLDDIRHELGTPITVIRGHLELLDPAQRTEVEATRELALDELDRMARLIDDIQFLASTEQPLQPRPVELAELTEQVAAKAAAIPGHSWRLEERAEGIAVLDAARLTQAWLQLADNAAKYAPEGTPIRLGSRRVADRIECWVADEGPGIPADQRERIFERFGRIDPGRGVRGSGLGLPIVAAIAERHGGRVRLEDLEGGGARFTIDLPQLPSPPPLPGSADPAPAVDAREQP